MLDPQIKTQLKAYLERVTQPIDIVAHLDDGAKSAEMLALLTDIAALTDRITLTESRGDAERKPSFSLARRNEAPRVRFAGLPLGHEFTSLILALLQVGGHPPKAEPATIEQIRSLTGEFRFETFVSLTCHNCPDVVQALNLVVVANRRSATR